MKTKALISFTVTTKRKCTIRVAKRKALINFAVTAKLICAFVFAYADCWFSHEAAHLSDLPENPEAWPRVYKTFFMLSSAETKIYPAHKC